MKGIYHYIEWIDKKAEQNLLWLIPGCIGFISIVFIVAFFFPSFFGYSRDEADAASNFFKSEFFIAITAILTLVILAFSILFLLHKVKSNLKRFGISLAIPLLSMLLYVLIPELDPRFHLVKKIISYICLISFSFSGLMMVIIPGSVILRTLGEAKKSHEQRNNDN